MILKFIIDMIVGVFLSSLNALPDVNSSIPSNVLVGVRDLVQLVKYFVPLSAILPIFIISLSLDLFNIIWKIILRTKSFIPTMGS